MSVKVMAWVWEHSRSKPVQRLVLLAIADYANDLGRDAYPSTATLAKKTALSERGVRKALTELVELGELKVDYKAGPRGCNRFRIIMGDLARGATPDPAQDAGYPEQGARYDPAQDARNPARHSTDPAPHSVDLARGAPDPSENHQRTIPAARSTPEQIVIEATGATPDEAATIVRRVQNERQPRSLPGLLRRMATDGDLAQHLTDHRAATIRARNATAIADARRGPQCEHGEAGGANPHPTSGEPLCPQCRTKARRASLKVVSR